MMLGESKTAGAVSAVHGRLFVKVYFDVFKRTSAEVRDDVWVGASIDDEVGFLHSNEHPWEGVVFVIQRFMINEYR